MNTLSFQAAVRDEKDVIYIRFPFDRELLEQVKSLVGRKYCPIQKAWYVPDHSSYRERFRLPPKPLRFDAVKIADINRPELKRLLETLQLKGYANCE